MEILSPSSNMEHIKVAIDHKANAVYGGIKKWNARNKAINFSNEEYNYLINELHKHGIKFFLTLNILMLDEEIDEAIEFLKNNTLPDSFIVTDIGLIRRLKSEFPNVPLHFSTQFGAHNIDDVNYVKSLGGSRAILARELTLDEINKIEKNTDIELECFVWGSQCLSFSGLCFFGTLINGGGGNRGKCIITCRDIYSVNNELGHYLYVPDMDHINLISKLNKIDCLKLEGRRRNPKEIASILDQINNKIESNNNSGYLYGTDVKDNHLYENINRRSKPICKASEVKNICDNDICIEFIESIPVKFSKEYNNPNVMYMYSEIKKDYKINKKNLNLELKITDNYISEILYVNYKGDGHTFISSDKDYIKFNINELINSVESENDNINLYKIKYIKNKDDEYYISKKLFDEYIDYVIHDCENKQYQLKNNNMKLNSIYIETKDLNIVDNFINDEFVKIIYDIESINKLKNINEVVKKYKDKIIYKLPLFNFKSEGIIKYLKYLKNMEVMFTRFTQLYLCKDIKFKKKYTDYTIYIWNKESLNYLKENNIDEFTCSPELSFDRNKKIFDDLKCQMIICGKLPLVYTRGCFGHIFGCHCNKSKQKDIKNYDKNLDFEILCNDDYRYILNSNPILNDYSKFDINDNMSFRYVINNEDIDTINKTIESFKKKDYYKNLKKLKYYKNSYECNLLEGKE